MLGQMKFLDFVGWFTPKKGYQRGEHRMRKIVVVWIR